MRVRIMRVRIMNCHRFEQRMNELLDQRLPLESDSLIQSHLQQCPSCRDRLLTWQPIGELYAQSPSHRTSISSRLVVSALAAGIIFALVVPFGLLRHGDDPTAMLPPVVAPEAEVDIAATELPSPVADLDDAVDSHQWWRNVQPGDWIAQTMPTVRSVQEGVAPIGRSFMQAVNLLTLGSST